MSFVEVFCFLSSLTLKLILCVIWCVAYSTGSYGRSSSPFKSCGSYGSYGSYGSSSSIPSELFASAGFSIEEIYKATDNFSAANVIGAGAFGTVYKGKLKDGSLVAVKRAKRVQS